MPQTEVYLYIPLYFLSFALPEDIDYYYAETISVKGRNVSKEIHKE